MFNDGFGVVMIGLVEKYIIDIVLVMGWWLDMLSVIVMDKKVVIIGVGFVGLGCVDVLVCNGVKLVVFDCNLEIGGLFIFGIFEFKLEKLVIQLCCEVFEGMGIEFCLNMEIGKDIGMDDLLKEYDVVFMGMGIYIYMKGGFFGEDLEGVYEVLIYLVFNVNCNMGFEKDLADFIDMLGKKVVVLGGGDIVMDCNCILIW